jgi:hypothetical protein
MLKGRYTSSLVVLGAICVALLSGCGSFDQDQSVDSVDKAPVKAQSGDSGYREPGGGRIEVVISYRANMGTKKETVKRRRVICSASDGSRLCRKIASLTRKTTEYRVMKGNCLPLPDGRKTPRSDRLPCREVKVKRSPLDPLPPGQRCTAVGGGEIDASIVGLIQGQQVRAKFTDDSNCEGDRWWAVEPVFTMLKLVDDFDSPPPTFFEPPKEIPQGGGVELEPADE